MTESLSPTSQAVLRELFNSRSKKRIRLNDIADRTGLSYPTVKRHIAILRVHGLLTPARDNSGTCYSFTFHNDRTLRALAGVRD